MVTKRGTRDKCSTSYEIMSLRPSCLSIEELEQRLKTTQLRPGWAASEKGDLAVRVNSESCGCLGMLCLCDGQDCVVVCESHCLIHYV
jgi:hypothetical protein